jgi:hypothetical protein
MIAGVVSDVLIGAYLRVLVWHCFSAKPHRGLDAGGGGMFPLNESVKF